MGGDYGKALIYSEKVINNFQIKTGKSEYICALTNFNIGGNKRACEFASVYKLWLYSSSGNIRSTL